MTRARGHALVLLSLCLVAAQCTDSPTSPSASLTGTWTGTIQDSLVGAGTARVTLAQSGSSLSGTWSFTAGADTNSGSLSGSVTGSSLSAMLTPSVPTSCPFQVTATINGNTISGTYAAVNCTVPISGSLSLTRQ